MKMIGESDIMWADFTIFTQAPDSPSNGPQSKQFVCRIGYAKRLWKSLVK